MAAAKFSIKTTSSFFLVLCLTVILFFTLSCFSSDPDPLQDFCVADLKATNTIVNGFPCKEMSRVTSNDFSFSGLMNEATIVNPFGAGLSSSDVTTFPGLNTLGLSTSRVDFAPGGFIPLHVHPRASEVVLINKGEVLVGFISTTNVLYSKVLKVGEQFIIPRGLVHFATNVGPEKAVLISAYNSQLPGTALLPLNLFASNPTISNEILAKNFQVDVNIIAIIKAKFILCFTVVGFFALSCLADPDPLQGFCVADLKSTTIVNGFPCKAVPDVKPNDFFYSGLMNESSTANPLGIGASLADVTTFLVDFAPGGYIPLHVHPRASEIIFIIKGEILIGFISTTNILYSKVLKAGELSIIPRGLVHFVTNVGPGKASMTGTYNSQLPGIALIPNNLFGSNPTISNDILAKNFQVGESVIAIIKAKFGN
ncbi:hypothetical protein MKX01_035859 [Papaver californicum]|nr:hypothetical protein MKX01_035859 [Papaver californicum]